MDNYIGKLLDRRYELLEIIGTGGMAVVYKARCHRLNRLVAIKILKEDLSQDAEFRRRFHAESQAVAMLSHPNIVNVYDVSHSDNADYIVMELIDGITLKQYMEQKGALNWREVLHFAAQIAKALEHAHSRGIIHRDIKPHNIMVLKDGSVKVADFGIARVSSAQSTLTREALGSVHYISPEQAKGGKIDYRSDIYSLGVVMYEMLTGKPPYDGETPVAVAIQHINAQAVPPRTLNPQIPVGLEQITIHAMAADMEQRYENASALLNDLEDFRKNPDLNLVFAPAAEATTEDEVQPQSDAQRAVIENLPKAKREKKTKSARSNLAGLAAGIIAIALAVFGIGYFLYSFFLEDLFMVTEEVKVPNFLGAYAEDINYEQYPELSVFIESWQTSETVEYGCVINQNPNPERMVKKGTIVALTVSSGPNLSTMQNLVNQSLQNALTILDNQNLNIQVDTVWETSDSIAQDHIIRTIPEKGEMLSAGQAVTLVISSGSTIETIPVPGVLGLDSQQAIQKLTALDLLYDITYVPSEEPVGTVIFQSIAQDMEVRAGTTVKLQVSSGLDGDPTFPEEDIPVIPQMPVKRILTIQLPDGEDTMWVTIKMDNVVQDHFEVDPVTLNDRNEVQFALNGFGVHQIDVLIDDVLCYTMSYDFDTGEIVP